ncbi:MAG: hypothetical protein HY321_13400 [Armatimonadetes bacterium]|nr:hypothetical protein [Armatimonadota bacterium]
MANIVHDPAAARGETVEHLARRALARWVTEAIEDAEDDRAIRDFEAREARGEARLTDREDVKAEWDALPDEV